MLSILESKYQIVLKILIVFITEGDWLTVNQLSEKLDVKNRTISNNLKFLKDNYPEIGFETSYSKGTRLTHLSRETFKEVKMKILKESLAVKLISSVYYNPHDYLEQHMDRLEVGRTTIYRRISWLNNLLLEYDIFIKLKKNKLSLESNNELNLRFFCTYMVTELNGFHFESENPHHDFIESRLNKKFGKEFFVMKTQWHLYNAFYATSILREQQGFGIKNNLVVIPSAIETEELDYVENNIENITISQISDVEASLLKLKYATSGEQKVLIEKIIENLVTDLASDLNVNLSELQRNKLQTHFEDVYLSNKNFKSLSQDLDGPIALFSLSLRSSHRQVYNIIENNIKRLEIEKNLNLTNKINSIVMIMAIEIPEILEVRMNLNLLIVSSLHEQHALFVYDYIKNKLVLNIDNNSIVSCVYTAELENYNVKDYDVIITNSLYVSQNLPSILIDDFPTDQNLDVLKYEFQNKKR